MKRLRKIFPFSKLFPASKFAGFLTEEAIRINKARMYHLGTLGLELTDKRVLEVGGGIGLLTKFFEDRNCKILFTDSRPENISESNRRYPYRKSKILDLEKPLNIKHLGKFEIIFCYGTLYHLSNPDQSLKNLSKICTEIILLETVLDLRDDDHIRIVPERKSVTQASRLGCRPTRKSVLKLLKKHFGHSYITATQPNHPDFILNWKKPPKQDFYRAIFIGSKKPLKNPVLIDYLPEKQIRSRHND